MDKIRKQIKPNPKMKVPRLFAADSRIIINLSNPQGEIIGAQLDIPMKTTRDELQLILRQLIKEKYQNDKNHDNEEDEQLVYSFFHRTTEIKETIENLVQGQEDFNTEQVLDITYHPQSLFRIKPVTRQTAALEGHTQPILSVQFRNQGDVAATASGDKTITVWDIETETPIHTFENQHKDWVLCVCWSPNGRYLASGGNDGLVCIWNFETKQIIGQPLKGHSKFITSVAWEPLHLNQECTVIASSSKDGTVRLWSRLSATCLLTIAAHQKCVTKMLFSGSGLIYTASEDTTIAVWNKNGHKAADLKGHAHWVNTIALHTDFVLRTACFSEELIEKKIKLESPQQMAQLAKEKYLKLLANKGERLVSGSDDSTICIWEFPKTKPINRMSGHQQPVNHVQFSPDGRYIVSASFDKSLRIWDGYNGNFICVLRGHVSPVYQVIDFDDYQQKKQVSWSSDSRLLLSASKDSTLKLWSLNKQKLLFDLPGHADEVYAVDWAPIGGDKAISGGKDCLVKIWRH